MSYADVHPRVEHQMTHAFLQHADTSSRVLEGFMELKPAKLTKSQVENDIWHTSRYNDVLTIGVPSSNHSLFLTIQHLASDFPIRDVVDEEPDPVYDYAFGVTREDLAAAKGKAFRLGFGDVHFPWHFSGALATAAVYQLVKSNKISSKTQAAMTLHDWANVIGTGWFSKLAHGMAFTGNGLYQVFGSDLSHYKPGAMQGFFENAFLQPITGGSSALIPRGAVLFKTGERVDSDEGLIYYTVGISPTLREGLRAKMEERGNSAGCPAARYSTHIPAEMLRNNSHARRLLALDQLEVGEENHETGMVMVRQTWTPIDKALAILATKLDQYENLYGTPVVKGDEKGWNLVHERRMPVDALRRAA